MNTTEQKIFEGVLLLSDIDGTLYSRKKEIPKCNIDSINRFVRLGGLFSIASGRNPKSVLPAALASGVNCPCVTLNGTMIYDYEKNKAVAQSTLPPHYTDLLLRLREEFPELGIQTYVGEHIHVARSSEVVENLFRIEKQPKHVPENPMRCGDMELPPEPVNKILLGASPDQLAYVHDAVENRYGDLMKGMKPLKTEVMYYEILPEFADKGTGALKLAQLCGVSPSKIAVVGDYYNDVEMLAVASLPMVANNAPEDIKSMVKYVACDCDDGAVADAIEHMEKLILAGKW